METNKQCRRRRGVHSTQCKNPNPAFTTPDTYRKRLAFIRDLVASCQKRDVTASDEAVLISKQSSANMTDTRQRSFYRDRRRAINALAATLCEHVNLVTFQFEISLRNAADLAGLSTISAAEQEKLDADPTYSPIVSISRASRALADMVKLGWVIDRKEDQVWDKEAGAWIDKYYEATPLFFNACGITTERLTKVQNERLGYLKREATKAGKTPEEVGRMSVSQIRVERKIRWRKSAFERRKHECERKKMRRAMSGKDQQQQRQLAQQAVLASLSQHELATMDKTTFKALVDQRVAQLRKFTGKPPTVH
ncbi:plasmid replication initiator RepA [Vibrio sp. H11]|uniref:plasmid replication initiator RepA n=1 Tax=Vibrio sp. H11 TaxID=2565928 RepID=UPI0010A64261|nr:plasmid replication initiator RepA [Vibrio sp. H11]